ncbi:ABC transporter permease subunit [Paracoccus sp. P2]|uniref:ABC transporter permease subunit n=1 Tax=Paracoccus sp. P2 TaxID=3248840 RepID=UPI00391F3DD7
MTTIPFWRRKKIRRQVLQGAFLAAIAAILIIGAVTAQRNLSAQGISSGFGFLWRATGWEMGTSLLPTSPGDPYWWFIFNGILNTLLMGFVGLFCATLLGLVIGLARSSKNAPARLLGTIYIEIFRNIPLIVQLFFWYAVVTQLPNPRNAIQIGHVMLTGRGLHFPGLNVTVLSAVVAIAIMIAALFVILWITVARRFGKVEPGRRRVLNLGVLMTGILGAVVALYWGRIPETPLVSLPELRGLNIRGGFQLRPEIYALAFAITVYGAAYIGEIVRGGFKSVGRGQVEAAQALGLSPWRVFSKVRMPLAIRAMLPILINQYVWLIKATTLGIAVGFSDFFMVIAGSITHSGQTLELIGILMAGFLIINFSLAAVLNRVNRAIALKGKQIGVAQ